VDYVAAAPGTHVLFLVLVVTTLVLRGVDAVTVSRVLRQQSTNLLHMSSDAPRVLFLSAFLLDQGQLWKVLLLFTVVMVPVERWIGTYRWIAVFVAGHVGATIATTVGIWLQVRSGVGSRELSYVVDVGMSYGLAAVAGVLVFRLPRPLSSLAAVGLLGMQVVALLRTGTFTDWGHLCALVIGLALGPLVRPTTAAPAPASRQRPRDWLRWAITPPPPGPPRRRRLVARVGGLLLLGAAGTLVVVAGTADTEVDLAPRNPAETVTVVGRPIACGPACTSVTVRLASGSPATLRLPPGTDVRTGSHLSVRTATGRPGEVHLVAVARRVHVSGLLGEAAVAAATTGAALLLTIGRRPSRAGTQDRHGP
jgi:hypothetical protein